MMILSVRGGHRSGKEVQAAKPPRMQDWSGVMRKPSLEEEVLGINPVGPVHSASNP